MQNSKKFRFNLVSTQMMLKMLKKNFFLFFVRTYGM